MLGMRELRGFLKDTIRQEVDFGLTPQHTGVPPPAVQKPCKPDAQRIRLKPPGELRGIGHPSVGKAIAQRESVRRYANKPLTLDELTFLLWCTQGVKRRAGEVATFRTVPSAGARHALETYVCAMRVTGLEPGVFRYLPIDHELVCELTADGLPGEVTTAALGQSFAGSAAAVFVWAAVPARMEWRYGEAAHKVIALDAGHVAQNLYLACEAIDAGTCAIAAYDQGASDRLLGVDGDEEFTIYMAPVGKRPHGE